MNDEQVARDIRGEIEKATGEKPAVTAGDSIIRLSGRFPSHQAAIDAGHIAAEFDKVRGIVNDVDYPGKVEYSPPPKVSDELAGLDFDVVIVGGGIIGLAVARELSRFELSIAVLERHSDFGMDQTAHSNAIIHPAVVTKYNTLKWEMNWRGNAMYDRVAEELDVDLKRMGTLIVAENPEEETLLPYILDTALKHKDPAPQQLDREDLDRVEPGLAPNVTKGVFIRNTGIISVFDLIVAYAENAAANGVRLFPNTSATAIEIEDGAVKAVTTTRGTVRTGILINAAGLYADTIAGLAGDKFFSIHPRKGETIIFDKSYRPVNTFLASFAMTAERSEYSKGGGVIPTVDGNLQFGPSADEVPDREDWSTTSEALETLFHRFAPVLERLKPQSETPDRSRVITQFAGCRAATYREDFIIEPSGRVKGLVHVAGIQSPGLASAPAIAERVKDIVLDGWHPAEKEEFDPTRKRGARFAELDRRDRMRLIRANARYGHIVCRCEQVSEGEIADALRGPAAAANIDAVKRRTRAGMGRCQGGFCMPRVLEIISRDAGIGKDEVTKSGGASFILTGRTKETGR